MVTFAASQALRPNWYKMFFMWDITPKRFPESRQKLQRKMLEMSTLTETFTKCSGLVKKKQRDIGRQYMGKCRTYSNSLREPRICY